MGVLEKAVRRRCAPVLEIQIEMDIPLMGL